MASECTNQGVGIMLHGYELKVLSEAEMDLFETHLLECDKCFQELQAFEQQSNLLLRDSQIRQQTSQVVSAEVGEESRWVRLWHLLWPRVPFVFKPAVIYIVLLLSIISTYGILKTPISMVAESQFYSPTRASHELLFHKHLTKAILLFDFASAEPGKSYHLIMKFQDSTVVFEDAAFQLSESDRIGTLSLPSADMKVGSYHVTISHLLPDSLITDLEFCFRMED
jgi:hypothetical protein